MTINHRTQTTEPLLFHLHPTTLTLLFTPERMHLAGDEDQVFTVSEFYDD